MCVYSTNFLISLHMFNWNYCLVNILFGVVCACSFLLYFFSDAVAVAATAAPSFLYLSHFIMHVLIIWSRLFNVLTPCTPCGMKMYLNESPPSYDYYFCVGWACIP